MAYEADRPSSPEEDFEGKASKPIHRTDLVINPGFCRVPGETVCPACRWSGSRFSGCQHPRSEQLESRSPISLALQQLELVDEAFHTAVAPLFCESRPDGIEILPQADGETSHRGGTGLLSVL